MRNRAMATMRSFGFLTCLFGVMCVGFSACSSSWNVPESAKEAKNPIPPTPDTLAYARNLYSDHCAKCHGVNGDGRRPPGSTYFYLTQPTKFTDAKIMDSMTDGEIFWKITTGNRPMPSYKGQLSNADRWELVSFLRTFAHPASKSAPALSPPPR